MVGAVQRAGAQLTRNRTYATRNATRLYLLRGLITCGDSAMHYFGYTRLKGRRHYAYYRCGHQTEPAHPDPARRCRAKAISAPWLEDVIWQNVKAFAADPGPALAAAGRQLRERLGRAAEDDTERRGLLRMLADKEAERQRIMELYRRDRITLDEAEAQLDAINAEAAALRTRADALRAQLDLAQAYEARYAAASGALARLRDRNLEQIELTNDLRAKREIVEQLVYGIRADTEGEGPSRTLRLKIHYAFRDGSAVVSPTP